jgi:regulator of nucleoside diphosphate kinase
MQPGPELTLADSLSVIWAALHARADLHISENEVHYLRTLALALDDDIVSCLLLRKLKLATILPTDEIEAGTVAMNSFVEFTNDGGAIQLCRLVHPSPHLPIYGLSVTSLLGAGLIGLRAGQAMLWPNEKGSFCELRVERVDNPSALPASRRGSAA